MAGSPLGVSMQTSQEIVLGRVRKSLSVESVKNWQANNHDDPVIVAACNTQLVILKLVYLGAFPNELAAYLAGLPDRKMHLVLPLAAEKGGKPRSDVRIEVGLNDLGRVYVLDVATGTMHSSLSAVRGRYVKSGGGSESWTGFRNPNTEETMADILGVDPALAHESRKSRAR